MKPIIRNVINHEEIKKYLEVLKTYSPDPLYHEFVEKNVKNFLVRHALIKQAPEDYIAPFAGPYHMVSFDKTEIAELERLCKDVTIRIHTKELNCSLSLTKIQLVEVISKGLEFVGSTPSFQVYKILTKQELNAIGNDLKNCLSGRNPKPAETFYVFKSRKNDKNEIVLYIESDFIIEARRTCDTLPYPNDWDEIFSFFEGLVKGRLKKSSTIISYGLIVLSLLGFIAGYKEKSLSPDLVFFMNFSTIVLCLTYCFFANFDSRFLHKVLSFTPFKRFFYEF